VRQSLEELSPPDGMGCIVRTAGVGRSAEELRWDMDYLLRVWEAIKQVVVTRPAPFLIYQEGNAIVRALRERYGSARPVIVAIAGRNHPDDHRLAEMAGFDRQLTRPFDPKELLAALTSLVR